MAIVICGRDADDIIVLTNSGAGPLYIADVIPTIRELYPKMIIMIISGYYTEELVQRWKKLGADDTLAMPFRLEVLVERLKSLLTEE